MNSVFAGTLFGVVSFVIGLFLIYSVRRRKFYRRGPAGLEGFRSFSGSIFTRLWESLAMIIGVVLLIVGGMLILERINLEMQHGKKKKAAAHQHTSFHSEMLGVFQTDTSREILLKTLHSFPLEISHRSDERNKNEFTVYPFISRTSWNLCLRSQVSSR